MAPSHVVFGDDGAQAPKYASTSTASPSTSQRPLHAANPNGTPLSKRPRVSHFTEEDEEERDGLRKASASKGKGKLAQEKELRRAEADRLKPGRTQLPIWEGQTAILEALKANPTIVILGETGSGKTTQVPQFLLHSSVPCARPRIAVTQPRRVAATSLAVRVSAEVGCALGGLVGYTVRFDDRSSDKTRLKYLTDGALLAEMLGDRDLERYEVVVLDEAHERSLRTDMLMGFLKGCQERRRDKVAQWVKVGSKVEEGVRPPTELKIIVMSATIDAERFSDFFDKAPILYVKGRQHPVKIFYAVEPVTDYIDAALKTIFQCHMQRPPGDILVFLPGQEDIESLAASIKAYRPDLAKTYPQVSDVLVCPLYARLSPAEQAKAFALTPPKTRKIILSTNVAETSVTIPGVKYVIDTGLAKEKEYHAGVGIDTLITESISQSSAKQRTGRAGRESAGVCYRLYTETDFIALPRTTKPEIQRVSLTFAILHLFASGQEDVWSFAFMDRPAKESIQQALLTLHGLGALSAKGRITPVGRSMASLPLEPAYARVLLASFELGCPRDIIDLVALLGARDSLLISNIATRDEANKARRKFAHRTGDHIMLLNILRAYEDVEGHEKAAWCRDNFINARAMGQVLETRKQLQERCQRLGLDSSPSAGDDSEPVLSALVAGLFANTAVLQPDGSYRHALSRQVISIHPGSILHNKKVSAIVYDELVMTSKTYARGVSSIPLSWLRTKAPTIFDAKAPPS